jgi:hypothetical protein
MVMGSCPLNDSTNVADSVLECLVKQGIQAQSSILGFFAFSTKNLVKLFFNYLR